MDVKARVNLYIFAPHPLWEGVSGCIGVAARDFQRAEKIALKHAADQDIEAYTFAILDQEITPETACGFWKEIERYRDVEDEERLVFAAFGRSLRAKPERSYEGN